MRILLVSRCCHRVVTGGSAVSDDTTLTPCGQNGEQQQTETQIIGFFSSFHLFRSIWIKENMT